MGDGEQVGDGLLPYDGAEEEEEGGGGGGRRYQ